VTTRGERKPAATEQEVRDAVQIAATYSVGLLTSGTFAGLVANARGCADSWPNTETIRKYVPLASVKALLQLLADKDELHPVKGGHWAVRGIGGTNPNATYWLPPHRKTELLVRAEVGFARGVVARAEEHAHKALALAHHEEFQQYLQDYARLYPTPDYRERW
jgi:hypothetical protein